ncbi:MAG: tRNA uridine-5-carboxymethylaminomethyl(34) synthesis GTPase MnmE [Saprospiraceae bacterium]|nr:tRNA uridine-5-carboxymethylaminomethyl(34) synthesis GTPase MnmE [Saprospiraceae bacterium]
MKLPDLSSTIVALATPPGVGAIGVIRLSGPRAIIVADVIFKGKRLENQASHTAHFGKVVAADGRILDEVLITIFKGPNSYTGEDTAEISCHGSPYILQEIIQLCLEKGSRLAEPGEFTLRAFLNGKMDLTQAEAVADLIASESAAAHDVAIRQLRGGFKHEIQKLRDELIHFASLVELELDFGEEDVEFADRSDLKILVQKIRSVTQSLIHSFSLGNALKMGVTTVIAGRPNAGKSTLLNALLNEERAIVSDIPGTTRDTIEEVLNIRGIQFRLIDTAGIREAQDTIEAIGVARTMEKIEQAAILVYVWDVAGGMTLAEVHEDLAALVSRNAVPGEAVSRNAVPGEAVSRNAVPGQTTARNSVPGYIVVCNKMDRNPMFKTEWLLDPTLPEVHPYLLGDGDLSTFKKLSNLHPSNPLDESANAPNSSFIIHHSSLIPVSAKNAMNIEFLKEKLFEAAAGEGVNTESTIVTNARHHDALRRADEALADVLTGLDANITGDFIAQDIRRSLSYLGEITGEIGVEDLLGNIFGKFCIGK